eukprot:CAMPEP_0118831416 /NCGR_PEP_ID=MMETSP1162-20130426/30809_1 /TAXON_ID=33656 /ORGANISM="Phaeocystis Sp, Strain CCMP2710" /LENGTH=90 /DNA_ID=CAMNT_0006762839 /DNA_START=100 /DNA_END=368 /DNA_ORIENTATION=+
MPHALFAHFQHTPRARVASTTDRTAVSETLRDRRKLMSRSGARSQGCRYKASCRQDRAAQTKDVAGAPCSAGVSDVEERGRRVVEVELLA